MKKYLKIALITLLFYNSQNLFAQKTIKAQYIGGQGCIDKSLILYKDSTFLFERTEAIVFAIKRTVKGVYLLDDTSISLFRKKRLHFLYAKLENTYHENTYRISDNKILMFSKEDESSKDANFIKACNTLRLISS